MGLSGMSMGSLVLIFLIAALLFGTKRLADLGKDLGTALRSFKKALRDPNDEPDPTDPK